MPQSPLAMCSSRLIFLLTVISLSAISCLSQASDVSPPRYSQAGHLNGELKQWHKLTLAFQGPTHSNETEHKGINPFLHYELNVVFTHNQTGKAYIVPGYFAADGNAANTKAQYGNVYHCHFAPPRTGVWTWRSRFRAFSRAALRNYNIYRTHNKQGIFTIGPSDKTGRDLRGKGLLEYVGEHFYRFAGDGTYFLKGGADSPENLLATGDFVNTPNFGRRRKSWAPHLKDFRDGIDPTWDGGKGKGIIGALNYLALEKGMNSVSFLTLNSFRGDDKNVFPHLRGAYFPWYFVMDVAKLAQWEVVFEHADHIGLFLHNKLQEIEIDTLLDRGNLGRARKLYYRELIARFGHHLAWQWNLGEENRNTDEQRMSFSNYFRQHDPYRHPIVVHTYPGEQDMVYSPLLGGDYIQGVSLQIAKIRHIGRETRRWLKRSEATGQKWVVTNDEQGPYNKGLVEDSVDPDHDNFREKVLWGNLMSGGAGVEYYFGYETNNTDLTCQDWRTRDTMWNQTAYALEFFTKHVRSFHRMQRRNDMTSPDYQVLENPPFHRFVIYGSRPGQEITFNMTNTGLNRQYWFAVNWFSAKHGGRLKRRRGHFRVLSEEVVTLLQPDNCEDCVALVRRVPSWAVN